ncbi:MAG: alpha/beta hydrolase [Actinomycetota bacterium]|nr:alpha/beta hydrolase [Actinomycetota bacterium]
MVEMRSVLVGGQPFGYRVAGEPRGGVPAVLLHATGETSQSWDGFMSRWSEVGLAYGLDLRGHGRSVWSGPYGLEVFAADVLGFMDEVGLAEVDLVGHSLGGLVACLVAADAPGRVRRLVLEDVGVPHPREVVVVERPAGRLDFDWDLVGPVRAQIDDPDPQWPVRVGQIRADTLVVAGGPSSPVPQEHVAEMAARIPRGRLLTVGGGHMVHDARPDEFADAVMGHLGR